jgi:hypothetical protein
MLLGAAPAVHAMELGQFIPGKKESHPAFGIHGNEINVLHTRGIDLFYSFSEYCIMDS